MNKYPEAQTHNGRIRSRGFTLVELMIVTAVIVSWLLACRMMNATRSLRMIKDRLGGTLANSRRLRSSSVSLGKTGRSALSVGLKLASACTVPLKR